MASTSSLSISMNTVGTEMPRMSGGCSGINKVCMKICADNQFPLLAYLINNGLITEEPINKSGETILHYIIHHYHEIPNNLKLLTDALRNPIVKKIINVQEKEHGATPVLLAQFLKLPQEVIDALIDAGADVKIPSKEYQMMTVHSETEQAPAQAPKVATPIPKASTIPQVLDALQMSVQKPVKVEQPSVVTESSLDFATVKPTEKPSESVHLNMTPSQSSSTIPLNTEGFVKKILASALPVPQTPQKGGVKSTVYGQRLMNSYSEISISGGKHVSKTDQVHIDTVKAIEDLLGVDEETAQVYKSKLYRDVKKDMPDAKAYERAVEMQKLATKENLDKIDIAKEKELRAEWKKQRESETPAPIVEEKPKKKRASKKKEVAEGGAMSREILEDSDSDISISSTSFDFSSSTDSI